MVSVGFVITINTTVMHFISVLSSLVCIVEFSIKFICNDTYYSTISVLLMCIHASHFHCDFIMYTKPNNHLVMHNIIHMQI